MFAIAYPNFCLAKTSFTLEPLGEIAKALLELDLKRRADMKNIKNKSTYRYGGEQNAK